MLIELGPVPSTKSNEIRWLYRCHCGSEVIAVKRDVDRGFSQSCKTCRRKKQARTLSIIVDGKPSTRHPLYCVWTSMFQRCYCPWHPAYHHYGGRGIKVCEAWRDFPTFVKDLGPKPNPSMSIDRVNNDGNYEPSNIRWATAAQQRTNQRKFK